MDAWDVFDADTEALQDELRRLQHALAGGADAAEAAR